MRLVDWIVDFFRRREQRQMREFDRKFREAEQERCPHKNKLINGIDDVWCGDCGKDLTE